MWILHFCHDFLCACFIIIHLNTLRMDLAADLAAALYIPSHNIGLFALRLNYTSEVIRI